MGPPERTRLMPRHSIRPRPWPRPWPFWSIYNPPTRPGRAHCPKSRTRVLPTHYHIFAGDFNLSAGPELKDKDDPTGPEAVVEAPPPTGQHRPQDSVARLAGGPGRKAPRQLAPQKLPASARRRCVGRNARGESPASNRPLLPHLQLTSQTSVQRLQIDLTVTHRTSSRPYKT